METWRNIWRSGFAPVLTSPGLEALRRALLTDDPRLTQGATTLPAPVQSALEWPAEGACGIGFCGWQGDGLETVGEVEESFSRACYEADVRLGEPAACRWFLNWYDEMPRDEMRRGLLAEVSRELAHREPAEAEWDRAEYAAEVAA